MDLKGTGWLYLRRASFDPEILKIFRFARMRECGERTQNLEIKSWESLEEMKNGQGNE
jgi:hypothetical protein